METVNITSATIGNYTLTGRFEIVASIKPDKDSPLPSKSVTLRFNLVNVPIRDVITSSLSDKRISWANGGNGRSKYATYVNHQVIDVEYTSPGAKVETREEKIAKYTALGYPIEAATMAVDDPVAFAEVVKQSFKPTD